MTNSDTLFLIKTQLNLKDPKTLEAYQLLQKQIQEYDKLILAFRENKVLTRCPTETCNGIYAIEACEYGTIGAPIIVLDNHS